MSKFSAGEIAIYVGTVCPWLTGSEVEIVAVGPVWCHVVHDGRHELADYVVRISDGRRASVYERDLRKRPQPGIPESVRSWFEVKQGEPA